MTATTPTSGPHNTPGVPIRDVVRGVLIELLVPVAREQIASPATLITITQTRRELAELYTDAHTNPLHPLAPTSLRHAALTHALGTIGLALFDAHHHTPHTERLHAGLTDLATITLAWLDALPPDPDTAPDTEVYGGHGYQDAPPF